MTFRITSEDPPISCDNTSSSSYIEVSLGMIESKFAFYLSGVEGKIPRRMTKFLSIWQIEGNPAILY